MRFSPLLSAAALLACGSVQPSGDAGVDASNAPDAETVRCEQRGAPVDVLFVMQGSAYSTPLAYDVSVAVGRFGRAILTGDVDEDGDADFEGAESLRIGVVSSVMGVGAAVGSPGTAGCDETGDDGLLAQAPWPADRAGCEDAPMSSFESLESIDGLSELSQFDCRLNRGDSRCVAEPLEAMLKAITPSTSTVRFRNDTVGHSDGANAGFLREDSLWVIVILGTRDDCSIELESEAWTSEPVCSRTISACCDRWLYPLDRYVDGLSRLRADGLRRIAVVSWVGTDELLPEDVRSEDIPWDLLVDDPGSDEFRSCPSAGTVQITPRLARFTQALGRNGTVRRSCSHDTARQLVSLAGFILERACR